MFESVDEIVVVGAVEGKNSISFVIKDEMADV